MKVRGISYLLDGAAPAQVRADLTVVAEELHCTDVMLIGSEVPLLLSATRWALETGLSVYVRPDPTDLDRSGFLDRLSATAAGCEDLRDEFPDRVTLVVGSELSHTVTGVVPGPRSFLRLQLILRARALLRRRIARRLGVLLAEAARTARARFGGPITYSAAAWEEVDWTIFDVVGVALYRSHRNEAAYAERVRELVARHDRPVVITEFGCGAFAGAEARGPGSFQIVSWFSDPPRIRGAFPRDEDVQARYLTDLIAIYEEQGVHGCFVFTFCMAGFPRVPGPEADLDRAGFGVVSVDRGGRRRPKRAFGAVADCYRDLAEQP